MIMSEDFNLENYISEKVKKILNYREDDNFENLLREDIKEIYTDGDNQGYYDGAKEN